MLLKSTKINLIISLALLLLAIVVLSGTSYFVSRDIEKLNQNIALIKESTSLSDSYADISSIIEDSAVERKELQGFILHEDNIITFLSDIELKGRALGLELTTKNLNTEEGTGAFDTLQVSFGYSGTYNSVVNFLKTLETLPFHSHIESLKMVKEVNSTAEVFSGDILLFVSLETYE